MAVDLLLAAAPDGGAGVCGIAPAPLGGLCRGTTGLVTDPVGAVAGGAIDGLAGAFASAAVFFLGKLGQAMTATTDIGVDQPWFLDRYALMFGISVFLTVGLAVLAVIKHVMRGQGWEVVRSATGNLVLAVLAAAFAPAVVLLVVRLSDAVTAAVLTGTGADLQDFLTGTGDAVLTTDPQVSGGVLFVTSLFALFCAAVLWLELLLRSAIVLISLLFAPMVFSGLVDRNLWHHTRRWVYFTIGVIFAKPVVAAVMALAVAGASHADVSGDGLSALFVALTMMLVSIFCVGLLFRVVPQMGDQIAAAVTARREFAASTPNSPVPGPSSVVRSSLQTHMVGGLTKNGGASGVRGAAATGAGAAVGTAGVSVAAQAAGAAAKGAARTATSAASSATPPHAASSAASGGRAVTVLERPIATPTPPPVPPQRSGAESGGRGSENSGGET